ncbi:MAG TPA: tetratricopeptide repeat protein [Terracidiphilus sp.]|nr:tetratricopeptide repeat protein [Terracidiphilus sp.]
MAVRRGAWSAGFVLTGVLVSSASAYAVCNGPQPLVTRLKAHPTTDNAVVLGSWYASRKQFDCAISTFQTALKGDPKSAQLHYLVGLAYVDSNRNAEALPNLQRAVELDPQVIKPHMVLAYLLDQSGKHAEAEQQWRASLAIDPKSTMALEGLSADMLAREDFQGVILLLRDAQLTEKLSINLAQALGRLNYINEAHQVLERALNASPNSVPLASAMTVVLVKQQRYQEAINLLQHAVDANPGNQEAPVQLFRVLVLTNHINQARPMGPKLLELHPKDPEVLYLNGIVYRSVGDYANAKEVLEKAVAIDGNFFNSRYNLGMVLVFLKEWQEARENLEKAIELGAPEPQVHFELAKALRGLGDNDAALKEMQAYQKLKKEEEAGMEASNAAIQGDKALTDGKVQEALAHYREAAEGEPNNASYKYKLSQALHESGDVEGERGQLEQAVKLDPKLAAAQVELGYLLSRSGDTIGAIEHFRLAVDAAPGWVDAWINLAAQLAVGGQYADARKAVATALKLDPENAQAKRLSDRLAEDPAAQQARP